ncbi:fungal zn(2)-Cys(6) binuclear cluster domain-containing protein [Pochonia chlamydosporia 170]|uniref:Fungal zn(2)-Cys(6) binuclear cluster domain-containing protein n=1 Tax=Pochonia chlamydosporia 170 TaxID=1380566 RepID=A0A179FX65_METCM|nr:fungal zn(2)-Cys(6) binuclear cluster domain-containing protein [Pochonia chlamydosporia 170]OAQ69780.2 fungal zn(2)-Cys(6) binuclear cluster domain-containing protein [Pochonia chlamydosporia 170]
MFNTWKQSSNSYVVLSTGPPFERPQNGKHRRSACNACRNSKIRCTNELTGCGNCQKRSLDCQYGTEGGTEFNIGAVQGRRKLRQKSGLALSVSPATHDLDRPQVQISRKDTDWTDSEITLGPATGLSSGSQMGSPNTNIASLRSDRTLDLANGISDFVDHTGHIPRGKAFLDQLPLEHPVNTSGSDPCGSDRSPSLHILANTDITEPTEIGFTGDSTSQSITPVFSNTSSLSCLCPVTALDTWETLITDISSNGGSTDSLARCQKAAMLSCEALVRCHGCSSRSQDVMLLIDICAKLLESLKSQDGEFSLLHRRSDRRLSLYEYSTEHGMAEDDEDDDEKHILHSFWMARMQRLGRLIARVGMLLDGEEWSAHRGLLQGVQVLFTND